MKQLLRSCSGSRFVLLVIICCAGWSTQHVSEPAGGLVTAAGSLGTGCVSQWVQRGAGARLSHEATSDAAAGVGVVLGAPLP